MSSDPEEFVGTEQKVIADPSRAQGHGGKRAVVERVVAPAPEPNGLRDELASPVPPKPGSHLKHAIERPRREYEAAQQETRDAHTELKFATDRLRETEIAEGDALALWYSLQPKVDPDTLLHDFAKQQTAMRAQNVRDGLPADGVRATSHGRSPVDIAASQRPRTSAQAPNPSLRSPIARRLV
jgi:hypothetical protein